MAIILRLDRVMADRKISSGELSAALKLADSNVSRLKNSKVKGIRWSTLDGLCKYLKCMPADIIDFIPDDEARALFGEDYLDDIP